MDRSAVMQLYIALCLTVLVVETYSSISWASEVVHRPKRQAGCREDEFRCTSGECIDSFSMCDGTKECADGSDETEAICKQLGIKCPPLTFQCAYGACIDGNKKCNGEVDCADGSDEAAPTCPGATYTTPRVTVSVASNCKNGKLKCVSGQCIDEFSVCDGKVDCEDGSDETSAQCSGVSCPHFSFRCAYGGCIEGTARCNGQKDCADNSDEDPGMCTGGTKLPGVDPVTPTSTTASPPQGGCLLPQPPETGSYSSPVCQFDDKSAVCRKVPGTPVPHGWFLIFKCNEGYYFNETRDENLFVYCQNGKWSNTPKCKKLCSPLVSLSVAVRCFNGQDEIDCSRPMHPGVRAQGECKPSYTQLRPPPYTSIFCRDNGQWSFELFYCQPVCGKRNTQGVVNPLIVYGSSTKRGEFPWHAGLYLPNDANQLEQICGGSLISPHIVLTAAHCVFSELTKMKIHPEALKVGLGKYYREFTTEEPDSVTVDVREILIPPKFYGHATSYALDIALIDLKFSVQVHASIMPVCIDWRRQYILTPGMTGALAGWGKTENGKSSDVLLYANLPYIDYHSCINEMPNTFRHYVTPDKFCAGYKNGTGAAAGDSGGGLTFVQDGLYHVYGIVSTKVKATESFATFTNITNEELFTWLVQAKETFDKNHPET